MHKLDWNEARTVPVLPEVQEALKRLVENKHSICWYPEADSPDF